MSLPIYLDHNATTPVHDEVVQAMLPFFTEHFGNPSSGHVYGERPRAAIAHAREQVGSLLGCPPHAILFTSGGTESNHLAIQGLEAAGRRVAVTSQVEHPATYAALERTGWDVRELPVDASGRVVASVAAAYIDQDTSLVTVMLANNETGAIQPIRALADAAHACGAYVHTDAAQAVGKIPVDVDTLGADLLSIAGHKLYAPKGVGALYVRPGTPLGVLQGGGGQESGRRGGTENVALIVGLGQAAEVARRDLDAESTRVRQLRDLLWHRLRDAIEGLALHGPNDDRLPNTLNVGFPGVSGRALLASTPQIAASTGSACHEHGEAPSGVLTAMGYRRDEALGAVRLSLGRKTDAEAIHRAADALVDAYRTLRADPGRVAPTP